MNTPAQEFRTILSISVPLAAAYLAEMGMMIIDMIIVGRLGSDELAAVGLTADWLYVLLLIGMGAIAIVGVLVAQSLGEGSRRGVTDATEQGMIVATMMSVPVMLCTWYLGPALGLAGQDANVVRLITDYSRPLTWSVLPALWFAVHRNYIAALARAGAIMTITVLALGLNVLLNYALVFGKFGLPALGVVGAAYGTTIVTWLMFAALAAHVLYSQHFGDFRVRLIPRGIDLKTVRELLALGLPITGSQVLGGAMFTVAAVLVGVLSADILAAQQIVYTVIYVALSVSIAIGDAVRVRVAYGIGKRSAEAARQSATIACAMAAAITFAASAALVVFPEAIVGIFLDTGDVDNANVLKIGVSLAVYAAMFQLLDGVQIVTANGLRGLRDTKSPLWISMAGYWLVGIVLGTTLCFPMGYGADGMWWGLVLGAVVANGLMVFRFRQRMSQAKAALGSLGTPVSGSQNIA